eukprot:g2818.t1
MKLRDETMLLPNGRLATDLDTLAAIEMLVSLVNPRNVVDVGTFTGISALLFALMVPDDGGTVITIDHSEEHLCLARQHWMAAGVAHKIEAKIGDGLIVLDEICQTHNKHCFDVAYIGKSRLIGTKSDLFVYSLDANKEGYDTYYEKLLPMIRPHGLILMDNLLLNQKVVYNEIMDDRTLSVRQLNRKLHQDSRISFNLLTIGDGLGVCRVKP